ncbi:YccF domain-containing protein [Tersicoccus phoenicis]|uniref:YccF domain-containing protein n=1 Tax=Tersicoccus phoenicis TaxID=554083 RepID=UPI000A063799|nr:YccF domain-containing protein [Tersicoccus phoenicis]
MRTLLNLIWFVPSGLWLAVAYAVAGVICCLRNPAAVGGRPAIGACVDDAR